MQSIIITDEEALALCQKAEDHFFDKKQLGIQPNKVERIAVALANSDGGQFIVGIVDGEGATASKHNWQGAESPESFNGIIQALYNLSPTLSISPTLLICKGTPGYVLQVDVEKGTQLHTTSDGRVYVRKGAQCLPLTPEQITTFSYTRGIKSFESTLAPDAILEELVETREAKEFCADLPVRVDSLSFLVNEQLIDPKSWHPRVASVLLFADNPSPILASTRCAIKISRYTTREEEAEREHLQETHTIEGCLYKQIHSTVHKIQDLLSGTKIWTTDGMKEVKYPHESLWEIIVNAVIHRDYSISDDIQIHVYDNRILIASPGRLPGIMNIDNILTERFSRNPKIVRTLARYKSPPNKDLGEGLNTAFQKMKDWKLKNPTIEEKGNYVYVTLAHTPLARPEEIVLEYVEKNGSIKNKIGRELTGIKSENSMKSVFKKLEAAGDLIQDPNKAGAAAEWIKPPKK